MMIKRVLLVGAAAGMILAAAAHYLGYHHYHRYREARAAAVSIERSFPEFEGRLSKAVRFSKNPLFYKELARVYLEMALAENEFGAPERRDAYLDRAGEALREQVRRNAADAFAFFEMGKVYMLYNFPLLTYAHKGRLYFRRAVELRPADEFLNMNVLFIFLTQWDDLEEEEKRFVYRQLAMMHENNSRFIPGLERRWKQNVGDMERLREIISEMGK